MSDQKLEPEVEAEIREYVRRRPISHIGIMDLIDLARDQRLKGRAERKASLVKASRVIHEREGEIAALRAQVEMLARERDDARSRMNPCGISWECAEAAEAREREALAEVERLTERLRMAAQHRADARLRAEKAEVDLADLRLGKEK